MPVSATHGENPGYAYANIFLHRLLLQSDQINIERPAITVSISSHIDISVAHKSVIFFTVLQTL